MLKAREYDNTVALRSLTPIFMQGSRFVVHTLDHRLLFLSLVIELSQTSGVLFILINDEN